MGFKVLGFWGFRVLGFKVAGLRARGFEAWTQSWGKPWALGLCRVSSLERVSGLQGLEHRPGVRAQDSCGLLSDEKPLSQKRTTVAEGESSKP